MIQNFNKKAQMRVRFEFEKAAPTKENGAKYSHKLFTELHWWSLIIAVEKLLRVQMVLSLRENFVQIFYREGEKVSSDVLNYIG